jgi:hypothetical protein
MNDGFRSLGQRYKINFAVLALTIVIFCITPFFYTDIEVFERILLLCAGLTNLVAILDISNREPPWWDFYGSKQGQQQDQERERRRVANVFLHQILFFTAVIGLDIYIVNKLLPKGAAYVLLSRVLALVLAVAPLCIVARCGKRAFPYLILAFILFVAFCAAAFVDSIKAPIREVTYTVCGFLGMREGRLWELKFATLHLLFIPGVYLLCDWRNRVLIVEARDSLLLDIAILITGFACFLNSFPVQSQIFGAGASAAVLILGNSAYVIRQYEKRVVK